MPIELEIDGQKVTFQDDEIVKMHQGRAAMTQKTQAAAAVLSACEKHGISPEEFAQRSEGAFGVLSRLIDEGVIDNEGNVVAKPADPPKDPPPGGGDPPGGNDPLPPSKVDEVIAKALAPAIEGALKPMMEEMGKLKETNLKLTQRAVISDLKRDVPGVTDEDIPKILAAAKEDPSKKLTEHAKVQVETRQSERAALKKEILKEHGIDPDADPNRRKEVAEGGAGVLVEGKKISFKKDPEGKSITPREATAAFLEAQE